MHNSYLDYNRVNTTKTDDNQDVADIISNYGNQCDHEHYNDIYHNHILIHSRTASVSILVQLICKLYDYTEMLNPYYVMLASDTFENRCHSNSKTEKNVHAFDTGA